MSFFDNITKSITQGVDRAKFEAEKFQRTTRIQGELNEISKNHSDKLKELGERAYELYRAGQIGAASIATLSSELDQLKNIMVQKEEELKTAQNDVFIEPTQAAKPQAAPQSVPIQNESTPPVSSTPPPSSYTPPASYTPPPSPVNPASDVSPSLSIEKSCPNCSFQMPQTALFCPNCGNRVG
jgi:hypothetical protein